MKIQKILAACFSVLFVAMAGCAAPGGEKTSSSGVGSEAAAGLLSSSQEPSSSPSSVMTSSEKTGSVRESSKIVSSAVAPVKNPKSGGNREKVQKKLGYIRMFDERTGKITLDPIEWITLADRARLRELKISEEDLPDGYYIYNPSEKTESWVLSGTAKIYLLNRINGGIAADNLTDRAGLANRLKEDLGNPYELQIQNSTVIQVTERYVA